MPQNSPISFEDFMRRALYHPQTGYYARHIPGLGRRGDFTTVPLLTPVLAQRIAAWLLAARRETRCRHIIEIGPGDGQLAAAIRAHLPWHIRHRTRFHLVETSPPLRALQQERLGHTAHWHDSPQSALTACHGQALIYSNELVDAFPVRRFQKTQSGWRELGVLLPQSPDTPPATVHLPPAPLPDSSSFAQPHPIGQIIEIHQSYRHWLESWLPLWKTGRMLTIDYGHTAEKLYHRQPHGTLRAYLLHQRLTGPALLQNPGRQDLTADVNFTDLLAWSQPWMATQTLTTLHHFCGPTAPAWLQEPHGPGHAFQVLDELRHPKREL